MKKIIIILTCFMASINFCSCSDNGLPKSYTEKITDETIFNNITVKKHIITAEYQDEEGVFAYPDHSYLNASIEFPQLYDMKCVSTKKKINKQLKEVVMQSLNNRSTSETLKLFQDIASADCGTIEFWSGENKYEILHIGDKFISLNYKGNSFFGGAYPFSFSNYATISLDTGEIISFSKHFSKENMLDAITSLEFKLIEGQYTGGYMGKESEVIEEFVVAIKQLEDVETLSYTYDPASTYNFAIDEQFVYISFPFYDSLDGYVTLRFDLDILK